MFSEKDTCIQEVLINRYPEILMSEDFTFLIDRLLSSSERQVVQMLVEGYPDHEIYRLLKIFNSPNAYKQVKKRAKKKILAFLGL